MIAGDADDNGDAGTVNPAVTAVDPLFTDFYALGGSDEMAAFLDLTDSGVPDIVAGFSPTPPPATPTDPSPQKPYQVAIAIPNTSNPQRHSHIRHSLAEQYRQLLSCRIPRPTRTSNLASTISRNSI